MAILNFPPTAGEPIDGSFTYTSDGVIYSWDGYKWKVDSSYISNLNDGPLAGFRNQLINGDFRVWQRGVDTSDFTFAAGVPPTDRFIADRWYQNQDTAASTARRVGPGGNLPPGYAYGLLMSTFEQLCQGIELPANGVPGQFHIGSTWTVSYWCNQAGSISTEAPSVKFRETSTGAGGVDVTTSPFGAAIETVVIGGETWMRFSSTFTVDSSPAASHDQLRIGFSNGAAGGRITGVQFEPGPVATPFEQRPYEVEKSLCHRYFQRPNFGGIVFQGDSDEAYARIPAPLTTDMRVNADVKEISGGTATVTYTNGRYTENTASRNRDIVNVRSTNGDHALFITRDGAGSGSTCVVGANTTTNRSSTFEFDAEL
jgi:hypothetical protein